ncbi:lipopolysaccharide biosynthesis protein [Tardiphaga sp. 172_B4_N1_3]|uniref:lipopolysaccharide biosynthesis protein n=1 Tax=Tardiphaga sp. 172_B4_N1_3 TaxID=3240787 RepID=UPI003F8AB840
MRAAVMGSKFALAIFIAHYLDLSSLGLYGLAAGAIAIIPVSVNLGMNHLLMRAAVNIPLEEMVGSLRQFWTFVSAVYVLLLAVAVVSVIVFDAPTIWILLVGVIFLEHVGNDVFYLFSNLQRHLAANVITFVRGAAWIVVYIPLAIMFPSLRTLPCLFEAWFFGGIVSMLLFVAMSWSWPWKAAFATRLRPSFIWETAKRSYLFYVSDLSFVASQYIDRYLVTLFLGIKIAGIYFLFWTVANATTTFLALVLQQKQRPLLMHAYSAGGLPAHRQLAWRFMKVSAAASLILSGGIAAAFQLAFPLLGQSALTAYLSALWVIVMGMAVRYVADFGAMALFSAHQDRIMTITNVASIVALVAAQLVLLPLAGLRGAGAAILITSIAMLIWRHWLLFGLPMPWRRSASVDSAAPIGIS